MQITVPSISQEMVVATPILEPLTERMVVETSNLVKTYGSLTAVDQVSLSIRENEIFGILGPNGAGKTTTLEMIEGIRQPDGGSIRVLGLDIPREARKLHQLIGVQLQTTSLWEDITVEETVRLYASFYANSLPVEQVLSSFKLMEKRKSNTGDLSGGQRQRLSLALAAINRPTIIFLDEPTAALDPAARRLTWANISSMRDEGKTVILTTHYMDEAEQLCDRVAIMDSGRVIALDTPQRLIDRLGTERTIECALGEQVNPGDLEHLSGVLSIKKAEDLFTIYTTRADATLRDLLAYAQAHQLNADDLRVRSATLEDVYLNLTGKKLRD